MDADTRLAKIGRLFSVYEQNHGHPAAFACCSAHAVADEVPGLVAELTEAASKLEIVEKVIDDLRAVLVERNKQIAELLAAEPTLDDDQPGVPR